MDFIAQVVARAQAHAIVLFLKGTPERPMSADSERAARQLLRTGAHFDWVDVRQDPIVRAYLPKYSSHSGFPQLFVHGELLGGIEVIDELAATGQLAALLHDASPQRLAS